MQWTCPEVPDHQWMIHVQKRISGRGCPKWWGTPIHTLSAGEPDEMKFARGVRGSCENERVAKKQPSKPIQHPPPTPRTFKQLYATAFRCAAPGCRQPLYRVNSATGETLLNSTVAHIHARSEGWARWKPDMTTKENRSPENLVPLCEPHAREIDATPDHFPATLLREWKKAQLAEFQRCQKGWEITDEQATEVASVTAAIEDAIRAIERVLPFSPRQRSRAEALDLAARRVRSARTERLGALIPGRIEEVMRWMDDDSEPVVQVRAGEFRVLIAVMGSGKTERAWRWFEEGLQQAYDDDALDVPVWLKAFEAEGGLEEAVRAKLGNDPKGRCRVVIDELDRVAPSVARRLLSEARQLVDVWPHLAVLATAQPGDIWSPPEAVDVDPWPAQRGAELLQVALGAELPWRMWAPETEVLLQRPLTVLALVARLASGGSADVSRLQLLQDLPRTIIADRRPAAATPDVWDALARLAILTLEANGPVRVAAFGNQAQVWQLTDTGLVVEHDEQLSFALPVFEQHFGAQAITSGAYDVERAAGRTSFPLWRYAIAFAIATSLEAPRREQLMCRVARSNPAALSWVLNEIEPDGRYHRAGADFRNAPTTGEASRGQSSNTPLDAAVGAGAQLREAFEALLTGFGPLAPFLAAHEGDRLMQWGSALKGGQMIVAEHRELTTPAVVALPEFEKPDDLLLLGWFPSGPFPRPVGDFGRWHWACDRIRTALAAAIYRRNLDVSASSRISKERLWILSCFAMSAGGVRLERAPIPIDELRHYVAQMMEDANNSSSFTSQKGAYTVTSADVIWLDSQLARFKGSDLECPWPPADRPVTRRRWRSQGYSAEAAEQLTAQILAEAVDGYRELVETNFPTFGSALGLYSILPVRIHGTITHPEDGETSFPSRLNFAWIPTSDASRIAATHVELRTETHPFQGPYWHVPSDGRPESPTAYHLPMFEDGPLPVGGPRPSTNLAFEWLARDLYALGWLAEPITFHD